MRSKEIAIELENEKISDACGYYGEIEWITEIEHYTKINRMLSDIRQMLLVIAAFTKPNTEGSKLLDEWSEKYEHKTR